MRAFDAILNGKTIDTVFYADSDRISSEEVYSSLVQHDGYDAGIKVREQRTRKVRKPAERKSFECMECGHQMTFRTAERASYGTAGCPKCGGCDIDAVSR